MPTSPNATIDLNNNTGDANEPINDSERLLESRMGLHNCVYFTATTAEQIDNFYGEDGKPLNCSL